MKVFSNLLPRMFGVFARKRGHVVVHIVGRTGLAESANAIVSLGISVDSKKSSVEVLKVSVDGQPWRQVSSLAEKNKDDPVYVLDSAPGEVRFGDGTNGRRPPVGSRLAVTYKYGQDRRDVVETIYVRDNPGDFRLCFLKHAELSVQVDECKCD